MLSIRYIIVQIQGPIETSGLNIEELTNIQEGIDDDDKCYPHSCGLGCFHGSVTPERNEAKDV